MDSNEIKFRRVIEKNTFYFFNQKFEEKYEGYLNSIKEILLLLKNDIEINGLRREPFEKILSERENGLRALLALTGFSNENLKRITSLIRVVNDEELNRLVLKEKWFEKKDKAPEGIKEWSDSTIKKMITKNEFFRKGLVNFLKALQFHFCQRQYLYSNLKNLVFQSLSLKFRK